MKQISCFSLAVAILFCSTFSSCKEDNNSLSNTPIINPSGDDIIDGIGYDGEFIVGYHDIDWEQMQSDMKIPNDSNDMELRSATIATIALWFGSQFAAFVANKSFDFVYNELFNDEPEEENISARFDAIDAKLDDISIAIKALGRQNELGELSAIVNNHNNITNQFGNVSNIWKSVDECNDDSTKVANVINSWWNSYNIDLGKISQYFGVLKENTVQGKKYHYFEIIDNLILYSNAWEHNSFVSRRCFRASETVFACQLASLTLLKLLIDNNAVVNQFVEDFKNCMKTCEEHKRVTPNDYSKDISICRLVGLNGKKFSREGFGVLDPAYYNNDGKWYDNKSKYFLSNEQMQSVANYCNSRNISLLDFFTGQSIYKKPNGNTVYRDEGKIACRFKDYDHNKEYSCASWTYMILKGGIDQEYHDYERGGFLYLKKYDRYHKYFKYLSKNVKEIPVGTIGPQRTEDNTLGLYSTKDNSFRVWSQRNASDGSFLFIYPILKN